MHHLFIDWKRDGRFILTLFIIKVLLFSFLAIQFQKNFPKSRITGPLFTEQGETGGFYKPIENFIDGKGYSLPFRISLTERGDLQPSARRMPGLMVFYGIPYKLFGSFYAKQIMILIQFLLSFLSVIAIAKVGEHLLKKRSAFYIIGLLYAISTFVSVYDHIALGESLSTSLMLISIWLTLFGIHAVGNKQVAWLLFAGSAIMVALFIRPALGLILPLLCLLVLVQSDRSFFQRIVLAAILATPFFIADVSWIVRNFEARGHFIPLEESAYTGQPYLYPPQRKTMRKLASHLGGQHKDFYPLTMGKWFDSEKPDFNPFSEIHYAPPYNLDSLNQFRIYYSSSVNPEVDEAERHKNAEAAIRLGTNYDEAYKKAHPFRYHVVSRLNSISRFVLLKTENRLPFPQLSEMAIYHKLIKAFYILYYNLLFLLSLISFYYLIRKSKDLRQTHLLLFSFPVLYLIILSMIMFNTETRYLVAVYPFWTLYSGLGIAMILENKTILNFIDSKSVGHWIIKKLDVKRDD